MIIAVLATLNSLWATWGHLSEPEFDVHSQLHFSREVFAALFATLLAATIMFASPEYRSRITWIVMTVSLVSVVGGFWLSILVTGADLPNFVAVANHFTNTIFGLCALALSWPGFSAAGNERSAMLPA
jgi:NAD/NADP transhydrogenase beta subunit